MPSPEKPAMHRINRIRFGHFAGLGFSLGNRRANCASFAIPTRLVRRDARPMELADGIGRAAPHLTASGARRRT
jgi:hypothetical protein